MEDVQTDKLAEIYIKIRDKRAEIKELYEQQDEELKAQQDLLAEKMLEVCRYLLVYKRTVNTPWLLEGAKHE
jgi:K+/H+ antiporter YhaU regulatory subunit KhtT